MRTRGNLGVVSPMPEIVLPVACPACGAKYEEGTRFCAHDGASLPDLAADALAGLVIADRYRLGRKLGSGGVGEVYLAEHLRIGRPCAIKLLKADLRTDPEAVGRFVREATNASRINHPHVTQIYDFGEAEGGLVYLAMEYVRGEPLARLLVREGPLGARRVASIILQIASALDAAHALGIVHCDLKPENVIVRPSTVDEGLDDVKIVDFGLSKVFGDLTQQVTDTGCFVGTPHYMAPEQLVPATVDWRCDVYAAGLLAFVLLTSRLPVDGESALDVMRLRLSEPPLTLDTVAPAVAWPVELEEVFAHVLARRPADRYQSAGAFARDLDAVIAAWTTPPVATTVVPVDVPVTLPRAQRRRPRLAPATRRLVFGAAGFAAAAVGLAVVVIAQREIPAAAAARPTTTTVAAAPGSVAEPLPAPAPPATAQPTPAPKVAFHGTPLRAMPRAETSLPAVAPAPVVEPVRSVLDRLESWTDPRSADRVSAERALAAIPALLPRLATRADSVEALYRSAEANLALGRPDDACATLSSLRGMAAGTPFNRAVASLGEPGLTCPSP